MSNSRDHQWLWFFIPLLAVAIFAGPIWRGEVLVPGDISGLVDSGWSKPANVHNPLLSDVLFQFYPWQQFTFDRLTHGELPLWNPYQLSGTPFLANQQSAIFNPVRLLTFVVGFTAAGSFLPMAIVHLSLFGFFTALWAHRRFPLPTSILLGMMGMIAGPSVAWVSYPLFASFLWLPLMLLGIDLLPAKRWWGWMAISGGLAGSIFSGNIQVTLFIGLFTVAYALVMSSRRTWIMVFLSLVCGLVLSAAQILPTLTFVQQSSTFETGRSHYANKNIFSAIGNNQWSGWHSLDDIKKNVKLLLPLLQPEVFGNPATNSYRFPDDNVQNNFNELAGSIGLVGLWLAIVGVMTAWRERLVKFLTIASGLMIAVIIHAPVFELVNYLPIIQQTSTGRLRFVLVFAFIALAGYGVRAVLAGKNQRTKQKILTAGAVLIVTAAGLGFGLAPRAALAGVILTFAALVVVITASLFKQAYVWRAHVVTVAALIPGLLLMFGYNTSVPAKTLATSHQSYTLAAGRAPTGHAIGISANTRRVPLVPNSAMLYGIHDTRGYEVVREIRYDHLTQDLFLRQGSYSRAVDRPDPLLNMLSVDTALLATADRSTLGAEFVSAGWTSLSQSSDMDVLLNPNAWPRAFFLSSATQTVSAADSLAAVHAGLRLPQDTVVETGQTAPASGDPFFQPASVIQETANTVTVSLNAPSSGYLILNDSFDPGWRAKVDGLPVKVFPANYALRAVPVPAGAEQVTFTYRPQSFIIGLWISLITVMGFLVGGVSLIVRRRPT